MTQYRLKQKEQAVRFTSGASAPPEELDTVGPVALKQGTIERDPIPNQAPHGRDQWVAGVPPGLTNQDTGISVASARRPVCAPGNERCFYPVADRW
jgi:hypothetical protein